MIAQANPNPDDAPQNSGGARGNERDGGLRDESGLSPRKLSRLVDRAIKRRWNVPADEMDSMAQRMCEIANQEEPKIAVVAASVVVRMEAQNQADEHRLPPPKPEAGQTFNVLNINLSLDDWREIRARGISVKDYIRERSGGDN